MPKKSIQKPYLKTAWILSVLLLLLVLICILWIVLHENTTDFLYADIYQDGELIDSIPLSSVTDSYTFTISDNNGAFNEIQVSPGSIGILSASCPDKLCVNQGPVNSTLLPITCLPNRLVIQIRQEINDGASPHSNMPDAIAY